MTRILSLARRFSVDYGALMEAIKRGHARGGGGRSMWLTIRQRGQTRRITGHIFGLF